MNSMNKQELTAQVADKTGLTRADAQRAIDAVFETVTVTLQSGNDVRILGFGTFSQSRRKASTGRNPRTGEAIQIEAYNQAKFKPGKGLKDAING